MDFIKTTNFKGLKLLKTIAGEEAVPSYINKVACIDDEESYAKLASSSFADVSNREFPINNKSNTWLSALYFLTDGTINNKFASDFKKDQVWSNIVLAAEMHDIGEDVEKLSSILFDGMQKKASELDEEAIKEYALTVENNGEMVNYFPINTFEEIKIASDTLQENKHAIPLNLLKEACENIYQKLTSKFASEFKSNPAVLSKEFIELAKPRLVMSEKLSKLANERFNETKDEAYESIAKFANEHSYDFDQLREKLDELCVLDIKHNIQDKDPLNPYLKTASEETINDAIEVAKSMVELGNTVIPFSVLKLASVQEGIEAILDDKSKAEKLLKQINNSNDAIELANSGVIDSLQPHEQNDVVRVALIRG